MTRLVTLAAAFALLTGCIYVRDRDVYVDDDDRPIVVDVNDAPWVLDGWAGCWFDRGARDDVWTFEATVDDPDGPYDVVSVWADVYDDLSGELVESFELYPSDDPTFWYSDWLGSTTWLDCYYPFYSVDLVAYDSYDDYDILTVVPATY